MNVKEVKEGILERLHAPVRMPALSDTMMGKQRLIVHVACLLILTFVLSLLSSHLILSYHEKAEKEQQIATMQSFLKNWQEKNAELNASSMRPVDPKQLDQVQTENLQAVADLVDYKGSTGAYMPEVKIYVDGFTDVGAIGENNISIEIRKA